MHLAKFSLPSLIAAVGLAFSQTASAHLPYVMPFQFNTDRDVTTLYAGSSDRYFEPEIAGGNTNNGFYDFKVTDPSGKTNPIRDLSRHKQLTLAEIETAKPGTYKIDRTLVARLNYLIGDDNKKIRVYANELKERFEKHKFKDGKRHFYFEDEIGGAQATEVQYVNTVTAFVTRDTPNDAALKPTGKGFELGYKVHPNKVSRKSGLQFITLFDGDAVPDIAFDIYGKGDSKPSKTIAADKSGSVNVQFDHPGVYMLTAWVPNEDIKDGKLVERKYAIWLTVEVVE